MRRLGKIGFTAFMFVALAVPTAQATFPGKNGRIFYPGMVPLHTINVYSVCPDGSGQRLELGNASNPEVSPDGTRLAYNYASSGILSMPSIGIMNLDGSGGVGVEGGVPWPSRARWSPDGSKVAYLQSAPLFEAAPPGDYVANYQPFVSNLDANPGHRLTTDDDVVTSYYGDLAWAPDGERIYFLGRAAGGSDNDGEYRALDGLYWVSAAGGSATKLLALDSSNGGGSLDISPDGSKFVLGEWIYDIDGGNARRLSDEYDPETGYGGASHSFSPDGKELLSVTWAAWPTPAKTTITSLEPGGHAPYTIPNGGGGSWSTNAEDCANTGPPIPPTEVPTPPSPPTGGIVGGLSAPAQASLAPTGSFSPHAHMASIRLTCTGAVCNGTASLKLLGKKGRSIGKSRFAIAPGSSRNVSFVMPRSVRSTVRKAGAGGKFRVRVALTLGNGRTSHRTITFSRD